LREGGKEEGRKGRREGGRVRGYGRVRVRVLVKFGAKQVRGVGGGREKAPGPTNGDSGIKEQGGKR